MVCQIKNRGVVTGIDTWTLLDTRNFTRGIKYQVLVNNVDVFQ